ncbi:MAG: hypothetical protein K2Y37_16700 [Pirellulales bacterium]|nr:hypothetical protein [Pirellulales bacterium]
MFGKRERFNPFYVLLIGAGIAFSVTACAYGVMAFRALRVGAPQVEAAGQGGLLVFLDQYGAAIMGIELVVLGICTFCAMALDSARSRSVPPSANNAGANSGINR